MRGKQLHTVWSGYISFGLVNIPVRAMAARSDHDVRLVQVHAECRSPVRQRRWCPTCGGRVAGDELVRGISVTKDQYVLVSAEDLVALGTPAKKTLALSEFVDLDEIDPVYFEKPYFLRPGEGGERPYALLVRSLIDNWRVGVGKVALRDREHLALIRPLRHGLVMHLIGFPDEVRTLNQVLPPRETEVDPGALELMRLLVDAMTVPFAEGGYRDPRREALQALIDLKIAEEVDTTRVEPEPRGEVVGLMDLLRRQLREVQGSRLAS